MRRFDFLDDVLQEIERDRFKHPTLLVQERMEILWLKAHGVKHQQIAELLCATRNTVQRTLNLYAAGGLEAVRKVRRRVPAKALAAHRTELAAEFQQRPAQCLSEARERIAQLTGIRRGLTQVREFLRQELALRYRKVAAIPVPPPSTVPEHAATQAAFLNTELEPLLIEAQAGKREVFFVDAAHFVLAAFLGYLWSPMRLFVKASPGRRRYNVLGAINAMTHELVRVTNEGYSNSQSVCELLQKIGSLGLCRPITVVLDNASYQRCRLVQDLAAALHIELLFLPSYSPNLNLIERLWRFTKKTVLNSRHHATFQEFRQTIDQCLDELPTTHRETIRSLMTPRFQTFENVPLIAA